MTEANNTTDVSGNPIPTFTDGQRVTFIPTTASLVGRIVRQCTADEVDAEVGPMYVVEIHVFADELIPAPLNMTYKQYMAIQNICTRYKVEFREDDYKPAYGLPAGYVAGWVGGDDHGMTRENVAGEWQQTAKTTIYIGCSPEGEISS